MDMPRPDRMTTTSRPGTASRRDTSTVIGNAIVRGRGISDQDTATSRHVAVINEAFARKFFKGEDPLGKRFGQHGIGSEREYEVVGVAKDARYFDFDLDKPIGAVLLLPEAQHDLSTTSPPTDANPGSHFLHDVVIATRPGVQLSETAGPPGRWTVWPSTRRL